MEEAQYKKFEVLIKFMSPGSRLAGDTYDEKGNKIKSYNEPFTKKEIEDLKSKGVEKLYYVKERPKTDMVQTEQPTIEVAESPKPSSSEKLQASTPFISDLERRPRVLICNFLSVFYDFFVPRMIGNGIAIFQANDISEAESHYKRYKISHLLIDIDTDGPVWFKFSSDLKAKEVGLHFYIFHSIASRGLFEHFNEKHLVSQTFDKAMDLKTLTKQTIDQINLDDPYLSKRSHLKILLGTDDNIVVNIYFGNRVIAGEAHSLSPSELTFSLSEQLKGEIYNFSVGDKLDRIGLKIYGQIILTQGEVIKKDPEKQQITVKFTHRTESLLNSIGRFTIEKLKKISFE